jgi:hypothetical protein
MDRRVSILAAALTALLASSACQNYNFNPVGHCLVQPGTRRVTLSDVSTADVLFVVDDSGSMATEQASLGGNFSQFLNVLITANQERASAVPPLNAIDFHLATTSTSVFYNPPPLYGSTCAATCPGATGSQVCCLKNSTQNLQSPQPPLCGSDSECSAGYSCRSDCTGNGYLGSTACCKATVPHDPQPIPCPTLGEACGDLDQHYYYDGACSPSYVGPASGALRAVRYPQGAYMAPTGNPKVLHFARSLNWASGLGDATISGLATDFSENVVVGTCGSPQEQGLEAAQLAVQKALAGIQSVPKCPDDWTPASAVDCWPHPKSKLVVVFVSDENDASSPISAATGVVSLTPDNSSPAEVARKYDVTRYADYFTGLGRSFGAAFIAGATPSGCQDQSCNPYRCCADTVPNTCTGSESVPTRYFELASELRGRGADVVVGSICDNFGSTLGRIGEIVKPPLGLVLPTQPAASDVTILRIARADGSTRKTCSRPAPAAPAQYPGPPAAAWTETNAAAYIATLSAYDWWFTATRDQVTSLQRLPTAATQYVYINHATGNCEANPGETYSLDYIGQLPEGGCTSHQACVDALGGQLDDWTCFAGVDTVGACVTGSAGNPGTCICGSPSKNACPP